MRAVLTRVQNDLFDIGADLSTPLQRSYEYPPLRVKEEWVAELEADCDRYLERLEKLRSFILPGGTPGAAHLHVALTVVRRAERSVWAAVEAYGTEPGDVARARAGSTRSRRPTSTGSRTCSSCSPAAPTCPAATCCGSPAAAASRPQADPPRLLANFPPRARTSGAAQRWEIRKKSGEKAAAQATLTLKPGGLDSSQARTAV